MVLGQVLTCRFLWKIGVKSRDLGRTMGAQQPGWALNESGDKSTTYSPFSTNVFLHKGVFEKKKYFVLFITALSIQLMPLTIRTLEQHPQ